MAPTLALMAAAFAPLCRGAATLRGDARRQELTQDRSAEQLPVWVHAFARSGSSTMLSMVAAATDSPLIPASLERAPDPKGRIFTVFEPCHKRDEYVSGIDAHSAESKGCPTVLLDLAKCRFDRVVRFHAWDDVHTKKRKAGKFQPDTASAACAGADIVAWKTVTKAHEGFSVQENVLPLLEADERLRVISVIRDPRSIYASWMSTWPFNQELTRNVSAMLTVCKSFASNIGVKHPRLRRVYFERLIKDPMGVMRNVYQWLGTSFGPSQEQWVRQTFGAKDCPGIDQWIAPYSDCHTNSEASLEKWNEVLTEEEKRAFNQDPNCQAVANEFGYKLG